MGKIANDGPFNVCGCGEAFMGESCPVCAAEDRCRAMQAECLQPMVDRTLRVLDGRGIKVPDAVLKPIEPGYYVGAESEGYQKLHELFASYRARITAQTERIGALQCRIGQLEREKKGAEDAMDSIVRVDNRAIAQLERENAALRETIDRWIKPPSGPREASATFPLNALKHSR